MFDPIRLKKGQQECWVLLLSVVKRAGWPRWTFISVSPCCCCRRRRRHFYQCVSMLAFGDRGTAVLCRLCVAPFEHLISHTPCEVCGALLYNSVPQTKAFDFPHFVCVCLHTSKTMTPFLNLIFSVKKEKRKPKQQQLTRPRK